MTAIDLKGQVALVTGSARRVGKAIALELARHGVHQVIHHSNSDQEAESTASEIRALGVEAISVKADQRQSAEVDRLFQTIKQHYGRLDILVNSASVFRKASILEMSVEEWQLVLDINLTGPFLCSQQAARLMRESGRGGAIINIIDLGAFSPWKNHPHHSVSKAGLKMLTEVLALSLAPDIRVNAIAPGPVLRDEGHTPEHWQQVGQRLPVKHTGDPSDVAQAVVFLASQPFITGETLRVDGGESLL
jgi:pteridine reductase